MGLFAVREMLAMCLVKRLMTLSGKQLAKVNDESDARREADDETEWKNHGHQDDFL